MFNDYPFALPGEDQRDTKQCQPTLMDLNWTSWYFILLKEKFNQKKKIQASSSHPYADGQLVTLMINKTFLEFCSSFAIWLHTFHQV